MIERGSSAPSVPVPARRDFSHPSPAARADTDAARRFDELVNAEPEEKRTRSKSGRPRRHADGERAPQAEGNLLAQVPAMDIAPQEARRSDTRREPGTAGDGRPAAEPPSPQMSAAAYASPSVPSGQAALEPAFTAMLDRVHLQAQASTETTLSMTDSRWAAREALVVQTDGGGLSLSLSMNMGHGSEAALAELRRRLEARGLAVDRVVAASRLES